MYVDGIPLQIIQAMGRWQSNTFQIYVREHPTVLAASLSHLTTRAQLTRAISLWPQHFLFSSPFIHVFLVSSNAFSLVFLTYCLLFR
jgi:hypothetical protein